MIGMEHATVDINFRQAIPLLGIFSVAKAKEIYVPFGNRIRFNEHLEMTPAL